MIDIYLEYEYSSRVVEVSTDHGPTYFLINGSYLQLSELLFKLILSRITISNQKHDSDLPETETRGGADRSLSSLQLAEGPVTYYGIINTQVYYLVLSISP